MTRTNIQPLLPHEVDFVISEFNGTDWNPSNVRIFINERIVVHSFQPDHRGWYFLVSPDNKSIADVMDLSDVLDACQEQIRRARNTSKQSLLDSLRDRLHSEMNKLPAVMCHYCDDSFLTIYGSDGEYDKIELSVHADGDEGPRLSVDLTSNKVLELIEQLKKAREIIISNKLKAKTV